MSQNQHSNSTVMTPGPGSFAANCLLARRMAQRGVRFIQLFHRGWDQHISIKDQLPKQCRDVDQASAALVKDLKRLGMLDDTLVVWGGEFGRTVYSQGALGSPSAGRDHLGRCFTSWMAGGGIKGGTITVKQTISLITSLRTQFIFVTSMPQFCINSVLITSDSHSSFVVCHSGSQVLKKHMLSMIFWNKQVGESAHFLQNRVP